MLDPQEALYNALRGEYELEDVLGEGGMGTVYLARDVKHDRLVAIKTIHPDLTSEAGRKRFEREIGITAQLQHPHILPLLDSGVADETLYYVMPFVEGESLEARLARDGKLPLDDAINMARDVAEALDYAHRREVIHRDIKPGNILLTESHALVVDFGIAKALTDTSADTLTQTGHVIGSPAYMAPEQMLGIATASSDVYALGAVLYESVSGRRWPGPASPQPDWEGTPSEWRPLLERALRLLPDDRFPDAATFLRAFGTGPVPIASAPAKFRRLGWRSAIAGGLLACAVWAVIALGWMPLGERRSSSSAPGSDAIQSIAVLPFVDMSPAGDQAYFSDGMAEEILNALAKIPELRVAARTSSFRFRGDDVDVRAIADLLGVEAVLEGTVRKEGDAVRITAQLINAEDGFHLWSNEYDRRLQSVFTLQEEIAAAIVDALRIRLPEDVTATLVADRTDDFEAYDLYLRGQHLMWELSSDGLRSATEYFHRAIESDPNFAAGWSGLAMAYAYLGYYGYMAQAEADSLALRAAERGLELDEQSSDAHVAMGTVLFHVPDRVATEREYRRAIELNPNSSIAHLLHADALMNLWPDRLSEGYREVLLAQEIDPLSPLVGNELFRYYQRTGERELALEVARVQAELFPNRSGAHWRYANILNQVGDVDEAVREASRAVELDPAAPPSRLMLATALVESWDWHGGFEQRDVITERNPDFAHVHLWSAWALGMLGELSEALREAERGVALGAVTSLRPARVLFYSRDYDAAVERLRSASAGQDERYSQHWLLSQIFAAQGRYEDAISEHRRAVELSSWDRPFRALNLADIYARSGQEEPARVILEELESLEGHIDWKHSLGWIGAVYGTLGESDVAFEWLDRALAVKSRSLLWLKVHPRYDALRSDPRFAELLRMVGLD